MSNRERYPFQPKTVVEGDAIKSDIDLTVSLAVSGVVSRNNETQPYLPLVLRSLEKMKQKRHENAQYSHFLSTVK